MIAISSIVATPVAHADSEPGWVAYVDTSDLEPSPDLNYDATYGYPTDVKVLQLSPTVLGGTLKDYMRGGAAIPGVQINSIITRDVPGAVLSTGHRGRGVPGTDAWQEFGQIVSLHGNYSFGPGLTHTAQITGLDPTRTYTLAVTANRDLELNFPDPSGRQANFVLQSVDAFTNASSVGTIASNDGAMITFDAGKNTDRGYVARWTGINPGADGLIDLSSIFGTSADNTAYGPSAIKVVQEPRPLPGQDITRPVITLLGQAQVTIPAGTAFSDPGATALDDVDGELTVVTTGQVDTSTPGDYTLSYDAIDQAGNRALPVTRVVHVRGTLTTATPIISGTPTVGSTLTASPGTWGPAPVTFAWQWIRGGAPIPSATAATYEVQQADVGQQLTVRITASKTYYEQASAVSAGVNAGPATPPGGENPYNGTQWVAYVDTYATAPVTANVLGLTPTQLTGTLLNHANGNALTGVTIQAISVGAISPGNGGANTATGTDAAQEFGGLVSLAGNYSFTGTAQVRTLISGLDPTHTYTLAATANRNSAATPAKSTFTLIGVDGFVAASSAGATVAGAAVTFDTDMNSVHGYVGKWTGIQPGSDGVIEVVSTVGAGANTAYAPGAIKLVEETLVEHDTTAPVITLVGDAEVQAAQGDTFTDPGATATDDVDGDLTDQVVEGGSVDTSTPGDYVLTYDVSDAAGNAADQVERVVKVRGVVVAAEPTISGTPEVGESLTVDAGSWQPDGVALAYQWFRGPDAIEGATKATYAVASADAGKSLTVRVRGTKQFYAAAEEVSDAVGVPLPDGEFALAGKPTISGYVRVGATLTANPGAWNPVPSGITYQWFRNGVEIPGATGKTYTVAPEDWKKPLRVTTTGRLAGVTARTVASDNTAPAGLGKLTRTPVPKISGTARVGRTLVAKPYTWAPSPVTLSYQWYRSGKTIKGATKSSYKLVKADKGKRITVKVTGKKPYYTSVSKTSSRTATVR